MNRRSFIKTVFAGIAGVFLCRLAPAEENNGLKVGQPLYTYRYQGRRFMVTDKGVIDLGKIQK